LNTALHWRLRGLGLGDPCGQGAAIGHAIAGNLLSSASSALLKPSYGSQGAIELGTGQLVAGAVLGAASIIQNFFGHPDCSKIATTQIVNQAEVFLKQNLAAWKALPADQKTPATQQQALQNSIPSGRRW